MLTITGTNVTGVLDREKVLSLIIYCNYTLFWIRILKEAFFQKEHFILLRLKIWIYVTEIWLEIKEVFKFDSLEACKGKKAPIGWLAQP